jgi:hypothetical protein
MLPHGGGTDRLKSARGGPGRYPPDMSESASPESEPAAAESIATVAAEAVLATVDVHIPMAARHMAHQIAREAARAAVTSGGDSAAHQQSTVQEPTREALGALRIEIHGSWSVADLIELLGRLEDGYKAAGALESLANQPSGLAALNAVYGSQSASPSADDLIRAVTAFQLVGGLRLGSLRYGSPGFVEVIGALNPLKTVKDGITENREINRKRDETHRIDEREREQQEMQHQEAMTRESRASEQQQQSHALKVARLQLEAESARFNAMRDLIDRLPTDQQSVAAAQLLQMLMGATEAIANDARIDGARMLEQRNTASPPSTLPHVTTEASETSTDLGLG